LLLIEQLTGAIEGTANTFITGLEITKPTVALQPLGLQKLTDVIIVSPPTNEKFSKLLN
jgi:hypothetical protein